MTAAERVRMWKACIMVAAVIVGVLSVAAGQMVVAFLAPAWTLLVGAGVERWFFVHDEADQ